jgi:prepilin-type N-terminal cleavage/methylation domain-containing protein
MTSERGFTMVELLVSSAVMVIVLGVSTGVLVQSSRMFTQQHDSMDNRNSAGAGIDMLARLLRQSSCPLSQDTNVYCQAIVPDPDGNGIFDSVRVRGDWNPRDNDYDDPYEDVLFTVALVDTVEGPRWFLFKREPTDPALVAFGEGVQALRFVYTNQNGGPLANPVARPDLIGGVTMTVVTTPPQGLAPITSSTAISVRRIK